MGFLTPANFYFFAFRENAENILPNTVAVSCL